MAELDIGKHCVVEDCKQKDFLPFICDGCSEVFCVEHRRRESHSCSEVNVKKETVKCGGNTCTSYPCTYHGCNGKELLPVVCTVVCEKHFCLAHRHQDAHECEKLEVPKPRMAATQQLVKEIIESKKSAPARGRRGAKNSETAAKVALMKLKLHAVGDKSLPQTERTYFQVFLPKGGTEKSKPIFFCSKWSVGKVVDYAASLASLKNNNNILTAKKQRLCHPLSGEALQMDSTLESWVSNTECPLYNGGNVILEYLDNDCKGVDDVNSYFGSP